MHLAIAACVTALCARGVHDDGAAHFAGRGIIPNRTTFEFECAFDRMESAAERELDFRLCGIELNGDFLRLTDRSEKKCDDCAEQREINSREVSPWRRGLRCHHRHVLNSFHAISIISPRLTDDRGAAPA